MRNARVLRRELDLWKVAWQQVETFLDQIDGAADKDGSQRRKMEGLLRAARAVEHERARAAPGLALGDPVITRLPAKAYAPADDVTRTVTGAWHETYRRWRLPGTDEAELAVGLLWVDADGEIPGHDPVALAPVVTVFSARDGDGAPVPLRLPSYPGEDGTTICDPVAMPTAFPSVKEDGGRVSLFSRDARLAATLPPPDVSPQDSPVRSWSDLARMRRLASRSRGDDEVLLSSGRASGPPWGADDADSLALVESLAEAAASAAAPAATLAQLRAAVAVSRSALRPDRDDLAAAAAAAEQEGVANPRVADLLAAAATAAGSRLAALDAVESAAAALQAAQTAAARARLGAALGSLRAARLPAELVGDTVEGTAAGTSLLAAELDEVVGARVEYPDGTLRSLRTLEAGFVAAWPSLRRWFVLRHRGVLAPALAAFREPFVSGLSALLQGGFTGLPCEGLVIGAPAAVGAVQVDLEQPASLADSVADAVEPGHLGILAGERPAAVVLLGVEPRLGRTSLHVSPLRLSLAPPSAAPGPAGMVDPGTAILRTAARRLTDRELRRGRSDVGPGHDAVVVQALALYSRLCLLLGSDAVERLLQGLGAGTPLSRRLVPAPSPAPLTLHGTVPGAATTLVVHGLGAAYWAQPGQDGVPADAPVPEPRLARPGEMLLLRGRIAGDGGAPGPLVQAVLDVDDVFAMTGDALGRMDTKRAAVLSTSAAALPPPAEDSAPARPVLVCGPDEPLTVVLLRRSWAREALLSEVSLRRDFPGFDAPSLAARTPLPLDLAQTVLGAPPPDVPGVDRRPEFAAVLDVLDEWTRHGQ